MNFSNIGLIFLNHIKFLQKILLFTLVSTFFKLSFHFFFWK
ncbi:hypothetical protein C1336_000780010 [Campylobacter jejuni subsp. jejuni 1336]|nr:hypothetical protein C1336_000780010 [Campylobacter jejuni subsp. jejuni 1336]